MSIQKKFMSILETNAFEQLASYKEPVSWNSMTHEERELLGILFVKQGEQQLLQGDNRVLESFELATKVAPDSPTVYFRLALVYAAQGQNIRCLKAADNALDMATQLDPAFVSAWHSRGNVLVRIGVFYNDAAYFHQADEKFAEAQRQAKKLGLDPSESLYWHWGVCWYHLGKHSGEAVDFFRSLEKFRLAEEQGFGGGEFHNDYGNILVDLACLIGREEIFLEAVDHYEKAVSQVPENYESWLNLACTYQRLYDFSGSRDYFHKSDECFERAADISMQTLSSGCAGPNCMSMREKPPATSNAFRQSLKNLKYRNRSIRATLMSCCAGAKPKCLRHLSAKTWNCFAMRKARSGWS